MSTLGSLTLYGARRSVSDFDDLIRADARDPIATRDFDGQDEDGRAWAARLYLWGGIPKQPDWAGFVREGFGDDIEIPDRTNTPAVIAVRVNYYVDRFFALTLGGGHHKLDKSAISRGYGLRVALNAIYEDDDTADTLEVAERIRQVETVTVGPQTMRALQQANRRSDFDAFETDAELDQLSGITGSPFDEELARRVTGKDSIRLGRRTVFSDLGKVCRDVARRSTKKTYQKRFDRIDRIDHITDQSKINDLRELAVQELEVDGDFEIAPPELVNFDVINEFELVLPNGDSAVFVEPTPSAIRDRIVAGHAPLTTNVIAQCRLQGIDAAGEVYAAWRLWECLDAQLQVDGDTYLLRNGEFHAVDPSYLGTLNSRLGDIDESAVVLPNSRRVPGPDGTPKEIDEGTYNQEAADSSPDLLCLDKKTVRAEGHTSPIEICDVVSSDRRLVHVKRKFSSSALSHLFSQGLVSSQLLVGSADFRNSVRTKIDDPEFRDLFPEPFTASNFEVVYGIVGDWTDRTLIDLPFFSKVNLVRAAHELRTLGYQVTYKPIGIS